MFSSFPFFSRLLLFEGRERTAATRRLAVLLIDTHLGPIKPIMRLIRILFFRDASRIIIVREKSGEKEKLAEAVARSFICFVADNRWNSRETDISIRRMIRLIPTSNLMSSVENNRFDANSNQFVLLLLLPYLRPYRRSKLIVPASTDRSIVSYTKHHEIEIIIQRRKCIVKFVSKIRYILFFLD